LKIYADKIERRDLFATLPMGVSLDCESIGRPRVRSRGWTVRLERPGSTHWRNSGQYGAENVRAASWDDHGVWLSRLFDIDPAARLGPYDGREKFHLETKGAYR
jgi:hypothetical protein